MKKEVNILKDIIYMENGETSEFDSCSELYEFLFGKDYFDLTEKERFIRRYKTVFYKVAFYNPNIDIVHTKMGTLGEGFKIISEDYNLENAIVIDTEKDLVMTLKKLKIITILESTSKDNILTRQEKSKYKGNYIII